MIEIHHAIGMIQRGSQPLDNLEDTRTLVGGTSTSGHATEDTKALVKAAAETVVVEACKKTGGTVVARVDTEVEEFLLTLDESEDEFGFKRYHQSEVVVRRPNRKGVGWFQGVADGSSGGSKSTVKQYSKDSIRVGGSSFMEKLVD